MRNELEQLAAIENYLLNPNSDKKAFETQLKQDADLKTDTEIIRLLFDEIETQGLQQEIASARTSYRLVKALKILSVALVVLVILFGAVILYNKLAISTTAYEIRTSLPTENEIGGTEWAQADSILPYYIYTLSNDKDEVIETPEGIIISIPKGSFRQKNGEAISGNYELEIKEAMNAADIIKAGLSTWSDDKLLETGGMFYINARKKGENLQIPKDANITASIPKLQNRNDMMLYDGVRTSRWLEEKQYSLAPESDSVSVVRNKTVYNNEIKWINPKKPITDLISVPMDSLNFYPPNFEGKLAESGYPDKSKAFKDSVYLSMKCDDSSENEGEHIDVISSDSAWVNVEWVDAKGNITVDPSDGYYLSKNKNSNGEKLFNTHCQRCHYYSDKKLTGPGLANVRSRWSSEENLTAWIKNSAAYIAIGDPYANNLFAQFNKTSMPAFPNLSDADIKSILDYLDGNSCGINPVSVLAFWNTEFNQTILATREFEKRMRFIHTTCDQRLLECYTKNLDKPLYYCDSLAMNSSYGEQQTRFLKFYEQKHGKPSDSKKITTALLNVFAKKQRELDAAYNRTTGAWLREQAKADKKAIDNAIKQVERNTNRETHNFNKEFNDNLCEAKRQLGQSCKPIFSNNVRDNFNTFQIQSTGWKNVDVPVLEATMDRKNMNFTDTETGKQAILTYTPISITLSDFTQYDIKEVYLIPSEKLSFMRMNKNGNMFTESLNVLYQYHLVAVGFKGNDVFLYTQENITAGHFNISLKASTKKTLNQFITHNGSQRANDDLLEDFKYLQFQQSEIKRNAEKFEKEKLRKVLLPVVFPCLNAISETAISDTIAKPK